MSRPPKPPKKPSTPERREMHTKLGLLTIAIIVSLLGFSIVIPLMPYYIVTALHLTEKASLIDPRVDTYSGMMIGVFALMQFFFAPMWGNLSDRIGRKPILMISLIGDVVFYAMFGIVQHSLPLLILSRVLGGIVSSGTLAVAQAYVADVTPPEERAVGLGMLGAAFGIGFVFGPALGGWLGAYNLGLPMYVASFLAFANAIYVWKYVPESRAPEARATSRRFVTPIARIAAMGRSIVGPVGALYLLTFLVTFAFANLEGSFTPYLRQYFGYGKALSVSRAGMSFAFIGVLIVIVQGWLIRKLKLRYSEITLVICGLALMAVGFLLFPIPKILVLLMVGPMVPIAIGNGLNGPSLRALISRASSADAQGASLGIAASFDALARFAGPWTGGWLLGHHGPEATYWFVGILMLLATGCAVAIRPKIPSLEIAPQATPDLTVADA